MRAAFMIVVAIVVYQMIKAEASGLSFLLMAAIMIAVMFPLFGLGKKAQLKDDESDQATRDRRLQKELETQFGAGPAEGKQGLE